ncbi:MAG: TetR family transcriptional regulator [Nocardia sp.]|uniref:TetR/AcrR family transcriptional regulator n=1 Tax=Nocardia sp. TaxID=1821 RepID=UPI002623EBD4|nr:TetR/AcrR family transcriptional regulator [Nocardia sp.]MCU1644060.1 TetR family transcriptional regulator [Nocardia sp.]
MASRAEQRKQTEARILAVARQMFADNGYDRTTIRGIGAAAKVDPGLVMHYFGNKQRLFMQCTGDAPEAMATGSTVEEQADIVLAGLTTILQQEPTATQALFRSMLTHPDAAKTFRTGSAAYLSPLVESLDIDDAALRADLIGAIYVGVAIARLVDFGDLAHTPVEKLTELLRPSILTLLGADRRSI